MDLGSYCAPLNFALGIFYRYHAQDSNRQGPTQECSKSDDRQGDGRGGPNGKEGRFEGEGDFWTHRDINHDAILFCGLEETFRWALAFILLSFVSLYT